VLLTSQWLIWRRRVRWWCRQATAPSCSARYVIGGLVKRPARASSSLYLPSVSASWSSAAFCWRASTLWPRAINRRCAVCPMSLTPVRIDRVITVPVTKRSHVTRDRQVLVSSRRSLAWESTSSTTLGRLCTRRCYTLTASRPPDSIERFVFTVRDRTQRTAFLVCFLYLSYTKVLYNFFIPSPAIDKIWITMTVWRIRGKIIINVLRCIM